MTALRKLLLPVLLMASMPQTDAIGAHGGTHNQFGNGLLGNGAPGFQRPSFWQAGSYPHGLAVGDLNGDGKPDMVAGSDEYTLRVRIGRGDGTFQPHVGYYETGRLPFSVAIGDFNRDGKPDLVAANRDPASARSPNSVSVLLGNGDGRFQGHVNYKTGIGPHSVAVGDFNGDGKLDLATANYCGTDPYCQITDHGTMSVLLGNRDGTFQRYVNYDTGGQSPTSVAAGDFNDDGILDLVVTNRLSYTVSVFLGKGDGTFQAAVKYGAGNGPYSVVVGDFTQDGKPDLAVANLDDRTVSVLWGNGDGTFQPRMDYATGDIPVSLAASDFDGDGRLDLVTANYVSTASVLMGNGNGTFQMHVDYHVGPNPNSVAVGDFNRDGAPDLALVLNTRRRISLLLNTGTSNRQ